MNMKQHVTVEEGVTEIFSKLKEVGTELVAAEEAAGRILSKDIISPENIPPFRRSPLDGYAFRAEDTVHATEKEPVVLEIIEEIPAGKAPEHQVGPGQAVKILTGAPLPEGADAVEKFEVVETDGKIIKLVHPYEHNCNVVPVGEDICEGDLVLKKGTVISPAYLGILAGLGFSKLPVFKKPVVHLISTGSELVGINEKLTVGKIRNSSIYTIKAFLEQEGAVVRMDPVVEDDMIEIAKAIDKASAEADLIFTTGGVSVGDYDMVMRSMDYLKADMLFWKLQMKPGSAFLASYYKGKPVISLSGNPASAIISMFLVGIPVLRKMSGRTDCMLEKCQVKMESGFYKKNFTTRYLPGKLIVKDCEAYIRITESQGNGILHPLHGCNILAELPKGSPAKNPGDTVMAYLLG